MKALFALLLLTPTFAFTMPFTETDSKLFAAVSERMMNEDMQTVVVENNNPGGRCMIDDRSFMVDLQYKKLKWDKIKERYVYKWVTVKRVNVNRVSGEVIQECEF